MTAVAPKTVHLIQRVWQCANAAAAATAKLSILPQDQKIYVWLGSDGTTMPTGAGPQQDGAFLVDPHPGAILGMAASDILAGATGQFVWLWCNYPSDVVFASA